MFTEKADDEAEAEEAPVEVRLCLFCVVICDWSISTDANQSLVTLQSHAFDSVRQFNLNLVLACLCCVVGS